MKKKEEQDKCVHELTEEEMSHVAGGSLGKDYVKCVNPNCKNYNVEIEVSYNTGNYCPLCHQILERYYRFDPEFQV